MTVQTYDRNGGRVFSLLILNKEELECYENAWEAYNDTINSSKTYKCNDPQFENNLYNKKNQHFFQNIDNGYVNLTSADITNIWEAKKSTK